MKIVEHSKGMSPCRHTGDYWGVALSRTYGCLGVTASIPEETAIVDSILKDEPVWHRGHLLSGWVA